MTYSLLSAVRVFELSVDHAQTREQFGRPIGARNSVNLAPYRMAIGLTGEPVPPSSRSGATTS
ncbi:MAG: acyl-CoA dehydrogenase family protein [Myxococcota bacterium]